MPDLRHLTAVLHFAGKYKGHPEIFLLFTSGLFYGHPYGLAKFLAGEIGPTDTGDEQRARLSQSPFRGVEEWLACDGTCRHVHPRDVIAPRFPWGTLPRAQKREAAHA